jgi:hypothetical protein
MRHAAGLLAACWHETLAARGIRWAVSPTAPDTWARLRAECSPLDVTVWDGASDSSVYPETRDNYAYRAIHDSIHLSIGADFSTDGEHRAALAQGDTLAAWLNAQGLPAAVKARCMSLFWAESWGQVAHVVATGDFPADQDTFDFGFIRLGCLTLD